MPADSESSISLPGVQQQSFRSSPPPYIQFGEMENDNPPHKSDPAGTNSQPPITRPDSAATERPPSVQRINADVNAPQSGPGDREEEDEEADPAEQAEAFDWDDLQLRYHNEITKTSNEEAKLMQEWGELMDVCCLYFSSQVRPND
jgi:hypothetical protein